MSGSRTFFEFELTSRSPRSVYVSYDEEFLGCVVFDESGAQPHLLWGTLLERRPTLRGACHALLDWWTATEEEREPMELRERALGAAA